MSYDAYVTRNQHLFAEEDEEIPLPEAEVAALVAARADLRWSGTDLVWSRHPDDPEVRVGRMTDSLRITNPDLRSLLFLLELADALQGRVMDEHGLLYVRSPCGQGTLCWEPDDLTLGPPPDRPPPDAVAELLTDSPPRRRAPSREPSEPEAEPEDAEGGSGAEWGTRRFRWSLVWGGLLLLGALNGLWRAIVPAPTPTAAPSLGGYSADHRYLLEAEVAELGAPDPSGLRPLGLRAEAVVQGVRPPTSERSRTLLEPGSAPTVGASAALLCWVERAGALERCALAEGP